MSSDHIARKVALNADVVGYSALVADDVDTTSAVMTEYRDLVDAQVGDNGGILASFVGDSFMAVFDDPMSSLRTAIGICSKIEERNEGLPEARRARFRMGMDEGEVTFADGNHHGDALNIAARIQAIAPAGGLAVSGRIYRALDEPALRFRAIGRQRLKNIPEQVDVYEFTDLPSDPAGRVAGRSLSLETPAIAVLPIHTEMVDDAVRANAGMIRQELLHRLSYLPDLEVVDAPGEPGSGPGSMARYILETGVHQNGTQARVFAVLMDMDTMNVVKSHRWATSVDGMFSVADQIAEEVVRSVEVELVIGEPARLYAELADPVAIEQIYLGWYHLRSDTQDGWRRALELFGAVARSHPESPYGAVLTGFAWYMGAANGWAGDPEEALTLAMDSAQRGADLGDPTGMAQAVDAAVLMARGNADEALAALDGMEIIRPTCDITYGLAGSVRRYLGQWERAVELLDVAMRLTGVNKPWYPTVKASSLFVGGRLDEAAALAEAVLEHQPNNLEALLVLAASQMELGLERRARATIALVKQRFPTVDVGVWLDRTPYQRREIVDRWKGDLISAGAIHGV